MMAEAITLSVNRASGSDAGTDVTARVVANEWPLAAADSTSRWRHRNRCRKYSRAFLRDLMAGVFTYVFLG